MSAACSSWRAASSSRPCRRAHGRAASGRARRSAPPPSRGDRSPRGARARPPRIAGEHLHLGSGHVRLGEPVGDAELAADRLRPLEVLPGLVEIAEPRVDVGPAEQRVGLDGGQVALARPSELLVDEARFAQRRPAEEHRAADLVPGADLATTSPDAIACSRARAAPRAVRRGHGRASSAMPISCQASARSASPALEDGDRAHGGRAQVAARTVSA